VLWKKSGAKDSMKSLRDNSNKKRLEMRAYLYCKCEFMLFEL